MTPNEQQALIFLRLMSKRPDLQEATKAVAGNMSLDAMVALAKDEGMDLEKNDIRVAFKALSRLNETIYALQQD